jgi:hypothetical protein
MELELSTEVRRHLRTTILVDSGTSVTFVPERDHRTDQEEACASHSKPSESSSFTGEEASAFYEEVLSLPQQESRVLGNSRTTSRHHDRKSAGILGAKQRVAPRKLTPTNPKGEVSPFQLFQYAQCNEVELLQSAMSSGHFDVDMQDNFHWTLLMIAAYAGHVSIAKYLLEMGAKWREYSDRGMNAVDLAQSNGHIELADLIANFDRTFDGTSRDLRVENEGEEEDRLQTLRSSGKRKRSQRFYCETCQTVVTRSSRVGHDTSIVHLYSCQHKSSLVPYGIPESNRGFQMLLRNGWNPERGLGSHRQGHRFPVKTVLKQDRLGFGLPGGKPRVTHFSANDKEAVRSHRDRHKEGRNPVKRKRDIIKDQHQEKQLEKRLRTIMNHDFYS